MVYLGSFGILTYQWTAEKRTNLSGGAMAKEIETIWYFITALSVGGAERTLVHLANTVDRDRYDVTIWTMFEQNPLEESVADDVDVRTLGAEGVPGGQRNMYVNRAKRSGDYLRIPVRFTRALRAERPDIVQSFLIYDNTVARLAGLVCHDTTIVTGARGLRHITNPGLRVIDRVLLPLSDYIVANSEAGADFYHRWGVSRDRLAVVYNGRDLDTYRSASSEGLRAEFDIPEDAPVIGNVGRLVERKGQHDLLDAWPTIIANHPDTHCLLVGDGPERSAIEARVAGLDRSEAVHVIGTRDDIPEILAMLDLFVFPSHYEGLPGAMIEAMAAGLPIVATAVDGITELITDGDSGTLVPPKDPPAIANAVCSMLSNPQNARTYGNAARAVAYETFSLDAMIQNFEQFYERISDE